jgi:hypothetical protein
MVIVGELTLPPIVPAATDLVSGWEVVKSIVPDAYTPAAPIVNPVIVNVQAESGITAAPDSVIVIVLLELVAVNANPVTLTHAEQPENEGVMPEAKKPDG